jgi:hypothetical protein
MVFVYLILFVCVLIMIILNLTKNIFKKELVCTRCHNIDISKTKTNGSFLIEVLLWLCFIVPGLIYSLWRLSSKKEVCRSCGSQDLVSLNSPRGNSIVMRNNGR